MSQDSCTTCGVSHGQPQGAYGLIRHLVDKIEGHVQEVTRIKEYFLDDAETVLVSYGSSARSALHVVENPRPEASEWGCWNSRPCGLSLPTRERNDALEPNPWWLWK